MSARISIASLISAAVKCPILEPGRSPPFIENSGSIPKCTLGIERYCSNCATSVFTLLCPTCMSKNTNALIGFAHFIIVSICLKGILILCILSFPGAP